jgi:hypothetical protein
VIDDRRPKGAERLVLPRVTPKPEWRDNGTKYGNLFLDHITRVRSTRGGARAEGFRLTFNFVYPNLYLVTDAGESVLITHGHYFEAYWALASDWVLRIAADFVAVETPGQLNLQELVGTSARGGAISGSRGVAHSGRTRQHVTDASRCRTLHHSTDQTLGSSHACGPTACAIQSPVAQLSFGARSFSPVLST